MKMLMLLHLTIAVLLKNALCKPSSLKTPKALYYDLLPNGFPFGTLDLPQDNNYVNDDESISRTVPPSLRSKTPHKIIPADAYNSPIYYIALPPQPYVYIPGMGYMPQTAPPNPVGEFLNLPVNFVSNGKPTSIYQWSAGPFSSLSSQETTHRPVQKPKPTDSPIIKLDNKFVFNGKPGDTVSILRDSYNALYSDALQNFYP